MELDLREFKREHNVEYSSWFTDPVMNKHLGPAWTHEELGELFKENPCNVLSVFNSKNLIGVVSLALPDYERPSYFLQGIAVKPSNQHQGVGTEIFSSLKKYYNTIQGQEWAADVSASNKNAQQFMEKLQWSKGEIENNMYRYTYIQ